MAINVLPPLIYNRISAGEVVEKPASVVKELVENSLDAGATKIRVEIVEGGTKKIVVSDNGCGIAKEDLPLAFLPHATSKISSVDDLDGIATLGFRGEALASIAAVSLVELSTKKKDCETGYKIEANGGEISKISEVARLDGTTLSVNNLFFNTPVRAKFLRRPKTEEGDITSLIEKIMLSRPEIAFEYVVDGKTIYNHASGGLDEVIYLIYGREIYDNLLEVKYKEDDFSVSGYIVSPKLSRPNRNYQTLFVNGRYVEDYNVSACIGGAYESMLMKGRFPIYVVKIDLPFDSVDVNIHPNKRQVKFANQSKIWGVVRRAVERALVSTNLIADFEFTHQEEQEWQKFNIKNDPNPRATAFDAPAARLDRLSATEGASYQATVDSDATAEKYVSPAEYQKKGIEIINMPEFSSIKSDKQIKNRPGGNIFFDHSGDSVLHEVTISVQKDLAEEQKQEIEKNIVEENFLKTSSADIKILGVVFKTYVITEFEDSIYVIDQHAMHERQLYDKLKQQIDANAISKQDLLLPYEIKLLAEDKKIFESKLAQLQRLGFEIKQTQNKFEVLSVPYLLSGINLEKFVAEILSEDEPDQLSASKLVNEKLCQTACKHAIRAGDDVSKDEIAYLIDKMKEGVALCPHGRPIVVKITRKELEKMFKRVL